MYQIIPDNCLYNLFGRCTSDKGFTVSQGVSFTGYLSLTVLLGVWGIFFWLVGFLEFFGVFLCLT